MHYFFLSVFTWSLCEGVLIYNLLVKVFGANEKKWIYTYTALGWGNIYIYSASYNILYIYVCVCVDGPQLMCVHILTMDQFVPEGRLVASEVDVRTFLNNEWITVRKWI